MIREQVQRNDCFERALKYMSRIMALIVLLLFIFTFVARVRVLSVSDENMSASSVIPELEILPDPKGSENTLYKRVSDSLNLTCRVHWRVNGLKPPSRFHIYWTPPPNDKGPLEIKQNGNSISLYVAHLLMKHTGDYKCEAQDKSKGAIPDVLSASIKVIVRKNCSQEMFVCPSGPDSPSVCIHKKFVCDGKRDCANGEDESVELGNCDPNDPCKDKLLCDDGRCIPLSWCCSNSRSNCNVTYPLPCCRKLNESLRVLDHFQTFRGMFDESESPPINHMGFLQTTIYTVIGCAMAFLIIVTILVIAICRVHMKRTLMTTALNAGVSNGVTGHRATQQGPVYDLDVYLSSHSGLLVTYNINNGVFVGHPVDPPPYSEVVASPPREGPPPPYVSHENLSRTMAREDLSRIAAPDEDTEDRAPHESDALLTAAPAYSPPSSEPGMSSCSTQTGNPETRSTTQSLVTAPVTIDTGTQVSVTSDSHPSASSSSLSIERLERAPLPSLLREGSVGKLRESFIGLRDQGKEDSVISNAVGKQACPVESRPSRSGSLDRTNS